MKKQDNWLHKNAIGIEWSARDESEAGGMTRGVVKRDPPRAGLLNYQQNIVRLRECAPLITFYSLRRIISKSDEIWWVIDRPLIADASICLQNK